ncbi:MAG TPA: GNAT family N-acetyltransferase, partial [Chitinophagaceae bacterium]|nr:GNAT family N-acetyltransferase [Chitinophagaceae bacterium]
DPQGNRINGLKLPGERFLKPQLNHTPVNAVTTRISAICYFWPIMNIAELQFKPLDLDGVKTLVKWAHGEGWNPGHYDADVFYAADTGGFYGFYDNNELVAGGSIVSYGGEFGFMGLFIVKHEYRSAGIGRKLWYLRRDALLSRLNKGASIGMDGVVAMQPFYAKGGFNIAFRDERYVITGKACTLHDRISPISKDDTEQVLAYDTACFGYARQQFMMPWLQLPGNKTFKYVEDGVLKGFAVVRKLIRGYKIGPLFAENGAVAEELFKACLNAVQGEELYIDIPVCNAYALQMVRKYNAGYVFECARMYCGTPPAIDMNKVFGITSFELG